MPTTTEFEVASAGERDWVVIHESSQSIAGRIRANDDAYIVRDAQGSTAATFLTLPDAVAYFAR
jgi:hypothetical protein